MPKFRNGIAFIFNAIRVKYFKQKADVVFEANLLLFMDCFETFVLLK